MLSRRGAVLLSGHEHASPERPGLPKTGRFVFHSESYRES